MKKPLSTDTTAKGLIGINKKSPYGRKFSESPEMMRLYDAARAYSTTYEKQ